jgi:hypothetical protein
LINDNHNSFFKDSSKDAFELREMIPNYHQRQRQRTNNY